MRFCRNSYQRKAKNTQNQRFQVLNVGAAGRIRTADLILTKDALYLLSYSSIHAAHAALYSKRLSPICCNGDPERARTVDLQRDRLAF